MTVELSADADAKFNFMDEICGGAENKFWDYELTINTTSPEFTECFRHTALAWLPAAILVLLTPFQFLLFNRSLNRNVPLPWRWLNVTKVVICGLLCANTSCQFIYALILWSNGTASSLVDLLYPCILLISMLIISLLTLLCRAHGIITSGCIFMSLFAFAIFGLAEFIQISADIAHNTSDRIDPFYSGLYVIYYISLVALLILYGRADQSGGYAVLTSDNPCPQNKASFLSQWTFAWFTELVVKGWRNPIARKDLWALNDEDTSKYLLPEWDRRWQRVMAKYHSKKQLALSSQKLHWHAKQEEVKIIKGSKAAKSKGKSTKQSAETAAKLPKPPSIVWQLICYFKGATCFAICVRFLSDLAQFISPQIQKLLMQFVKDGTSPAWHGYAFAVLLFAGAMFQSITQNKSMHIAFRNSMNIRTLLVDTLFKKTLKLSNVARKEKTVGEIVNLMAVDAQRFSDGGHFAILLLTTPLQIIFAMYFLFDILGPSVLAGVLTIIILMPINGVLTAMQRKRQVELMKKKDSRMKLMSEILNGIRVLKLYAWEPPFEGKVREIRHEELDSLKRGSVLSALSTLVTNCAPFLVSAVTFATYVLSSPDNILTPEKAFVSVSLFNILRFPLAMLPNIITFLVNANVSNKRLKEFLVAEELDLGAVSHDKTTGEAITVRNGTFAWDNERETSTLSNINLNVAKGSFVAIVGTVGSGKSSLLSAILGEMEKEEGTVNVTGTIAYVPQQAWVLNSTLQENILFGKPYDAERYDKVLDACALRPDIEILPAGDKTEIGEKGINLSGGQKQRVSLARAIYQNADIYILDDPLSAVDAHVGKHIFDNVLSSDGMLKNKTRVLVTHGLSYLKYTDNVVVISHGSISEMGTYTSLIRRKGAFAEFLETYLLERGRSVEPQTEDEAFVDEVISELEKADPIVRQRLTSSRSHLSQHDDDRKQPSRETSLVRNGSVGGNKMDSKTISPAPVFQQQANGKLKQDKKSTEKETPKAAVKSKGDGKLTDAERMETKKVKFSIYVSYLRAVGYLTILFMAILYAASTGLGISSNVWLAQWTDGNATADISGRNLELTVYTLLGLGQSAFIFLATLTMIRSMVLASAKLHGNMLHNLMRSPMSFYDTTPMGRIFNRCGKDTDLMDGSLPSTIQTLVQTYLNVLATIVVVLLSTPMFAAVVVPLMILYYLLQKLYISSARQFKRLDSVTRSPIYGNFAETISGAASIRAYGAQNRFIELSRELVDLNQRAAYPTLTSNRWLGIRLELLGNAIVLSAAVFAVLYRDTISAGIVGLSITYALTVTRNLGMAVRTSGEVETNIVAVERIVEYTNLETEAEWNSSNPPADDWPTEGVVEFDHYTVRYRAGLDLVLKGLNCRINQQENVGIVGRTGAGKSSLTLSLFRILEAAGGRILIDGIDISTIGLHDLRSKLTIIPQDPVLFSGNLRTNLDPFEAHSDTELWRAIEHAHLKAFVSTLPDKLDCRISEGGENLSVGQRQLVCLARALLRKTRLLILDEATAAVDLETDDLIQRTIRQEFQDCTILTIAHRLNTVMDYDKVMVLDHGQIVEYESPATLLANRNSIFYGMAKNAGLVN